MSERDTRSVQAELLVSAGVSRLDASDALGFADIFDMHQACCDLRWKLAARNVCKTAVSPLGELS